MGKKAQRLSHSWTWTAMGQTVSETESKRADAMDRVLDVLFGSGSSRLVVHNARHGRSSGSGMCKRRRVKMEGNGARESC
jgi:hypothetical protein